MSGKPFLLVLAGPNGSGKSTLTDYLLSAGIDFGSYINPDQIAATLDLPEPQRSMQAQRIADFQREACLLNKDDLSFETVMSHPSKVEFMVRAHDAGYDVTLYYVATSDPEINVRRVENRVRAGGHDVPEDRIRARYWRSLDLLSSAALVARRTVAFDNSALWVHPRRSGLGNRKNRLRPVAEVTYVGSNDLQITIEHDPPHWTLTYLIERLQAVVRESRGRMRLAICRKEGTLS